MMFKAKFSDGSIKERSSANNYTHAWRVIHPKGQIETGFSSSEKGANTAANYEAGKYHRAYLIMSSNEKNKAKKLQADYIKTCKIEIVKTFN